MTERVIRTPDQRLRVFISSTLQEMAEEREAARAAVARLHLSPVMFEMGARPHPPRDLYRAYLEQSHVFVGLYWQRYGWIAPGETVSGLEDEYRLSRDKPRLIYIKSPAPEREQRLTDLLDSVKDDASYKYFKTSDELRRLIENDLMVLLTERFDTPEPASSPAALALGAARPGNIPAAVNSFIGRERELAEVETRLRQVRLLTLSGSGGTGKTRLALQAAMDIQQDFEDGVFVVDLTASRDADSVLAAIIRACQFRESGERSLAEEIKAQIAGRRLLLVLDNFEQAIAAGPVVVDLLRECAGLTVLVTSREALRVTGEHVLVLSPLAVPKPGLGRLSARELSGSEAVQLFVDRAQAVAPGFELTDDSAPFVAELCARLDGLPLAIELAAARSRRFSPREMVEHLGDRLQLLRGGPRDLPERQRTLRSTIDWSYELLHEDERKHFAVVGAFSGATIEAIERVAGSLGALLATDAEIADVVSSLVDKSLLQAGPQADGRWRLSMLETIREYALMRLEEDPALAASVRRAHATYFAELTSRLAGEIMQDRDESAFDALAVELDNVRAAWKFWLLEGDLEQLHKLTDGLWMLYDARGWYQPMVELANDLLARLSAEPPTSPERVGDQIALQMSLTRVLMTVKGYTPEVEEAFQLGLALAEREAEAADLLPVLRSVASFYLFLADMPRAMEIGERIVRLAEHEGDAAMRAEGEVLVGVVRAMSGEVTGGVEQLEAGIAGFARHPYRPHRFRAGNHPEVVALSASGLALWVAGFPERALARANEAIARADRLAQPASMAFARFHAGLLHVWCREHARALELARQVLNIAERHELPVWTAVASCLRGAALAAVGSPQEGLASIRRGVDEYRGLRTAPVFWPMLRYLQAGVCGFASLPAEGLNYIDEALSGEHRGALDPEYFRLKAELLVQCSWDNVASAESLLETAHAIAAQTGAAMIRLRIALTLARLWKQQGKREESRALLADAVGSVSEGFAIPDMVDARTLLDELAL